jgi:hypothetical protein
MTANDIATIFVALAWGTAIAVLFWYGAKNGK